MNRKDVKKNKGGRPITTGTGQLVAVRILPDLMAGLDAWAAKQDSGLSRPEALRRIAVEFLKRRGML